MSSRSEPAWDYVVVGAGLAGSVLANRLSVDPACRVLLVDSIPRSRSEARYFTEPEAELDGRRLCWSRPHALDGTGRAGAGIYVRGQREDYDEWGARGNAGWEFAAVLPCFRRAERSWRGEGPFHGAAGPVTVAVPRPLHPLSRVFLDAARERGLRANDDFNGAAQEGVGLYERAQDDGRGGSAAAAAYLRPAGARRNLRVLTGVSPLRVLFEGSRAVGVECARGSSVQQLRATRGVLLSEGGVGSPRLLMLSGIGDALQLRTLGIGVVANLPGVGGNLQDALGVGVAWQGNAERGARCAAPGALEAFTGALRRLLPGGRAADPAAHAEAGGFVRSALARDARPDLQLRFMPRWSGQLREREPRCDGFTLQVSGLRPLSRGALPLASADPAVPPRIAPHYLSEREDLDLLIDGVRIARELAGAGAFDAWRGAELSPGPGHESRRALIEYMRRHADTLCTPAGTCRMGPAGEAGAVVDAALRVHGVERLRVVDASVMPHLVGGNLLAPTMMIAERAAELLLAEPG